MIILKKIENSFPTRTLGDSLKSMLIQLIIKLFQNMRTYYTVYSTTLLIRHVLFCLVLKMSRGNINLNTYVLVAIYCLEDRSIVLYDDVLYMGDTYYHRLSLYSN